MREQIGDRVAAVIDHLFGVPAEALQTDTPLQDGLQLDSLSVVELQVAIEDDLGFRFSAEETADVVTYGDLLDACVAARQRERAAS